MKVVKLIGFFVILAIMLLSIGCFKEGMGSEKTGPAIETVEKNIETETITETVTETTSETITETITETETETVVETSTETEVIPSTSNTNLTQEEAVNIAMGVSQGDVDRIETEIEDGRLIWKIRIISNGTRTDIRIDDLTGDVVRVETKED